jgi:hypothetical protein
LLVIPACLALATMTLPFSASAQIGLDVSVTVAPPPLPVYEQPALPALGYIWTPGYWAYGDDGYFWVPGTWVEPPAVGLLWTPGYWGWNGGRYSFNNGYWGTQVGFYGGVNYGFGYGGEGYEGGMWRGGQFSYNRTVNNFGGVHVTNVYEKTVTNVTVNRVSYNGGQGGIDRRPTSQEAAYAHESHRPPTAAQVQHRDVAGKTPDLRASVNHGKVPPAMAATSRPGEIARAPGAAASRPAVEPRPGEARTGTMAARPVTDRATAHGATEHTTPAEAARERSGAMARPGEAATRPAETRPGATPRREVTDRATAHGATEHTTPAEATRENHAAARPERTVRTPERAEIRATPPAEHAVAHERPTSEPAAARRVAAPRAEPRAAAPHSEAAPHAAPHPAASPHPAGEEKPKR